MMKCCNEVTIAALEARVEVLVGMLAHIFATAEGRVDIFPADGHWLSVRDTAALALADTPAKEAQGGKAADLEASRELSALSREPEPKMKRWSAEELHAEVAYYGTEPQKRVIHAFIDFVGARRAPPSSGRGRLTTSAGQDD